MTMLDLYRCLLLMTTTLESMTNKTSLSSLFQLTNMAIGHKHRLRQDNFNIAFYNSSFPDNETTIIKPRIGCSFILPNGLWLLKTTLYGLQHSPRHWFKNLTSNLKNMGLTASPHETYMCMGSLTRGEKYNIHWHICV